MSAAAEETSGRARQALVVRGGWEGHRPGASTDAFLPFLREAGFAVRVEDSPAVYADAPVMAEVDLVLQCVTMSSIEQDAVAGLRSAVAAGTGFAGWHGGIADSFRATSDYLQLVGGCFAAHPPEPTTERTGEEVDNYRTYRVELTELGRTHPVTEGLQDFELTTEQYWVLSDDYNDVLATTTLANRAGDLWHRPVTCPAVWARQWGQGRLLVCTPGHEPAVLAVSEVRTIVERALLWAAR